MEHKLPADLAKICIWRYDWPECRRTRRMRAVLAACVLLLLAVGPVAADCSLDQAISEIRVGAMKRQADLAKTSMAILHKIEVINNKATIQNKPIINQLSK